MKKLFKNFRIWNLCVIFIISVLCLRAFCVRAAAASSDYHEADDVYDLPHTTYKPTDGKYNVKGQPLQPVQDLDEHRVRHHISDEEEPKEVPTKVKINGDLATPPPNSNVKLDFVPKQTYVQVRRYDTEVHLPRSAAVAEAQTAEEKLNAPRLREIVSHTKKQEVYEEQGYEDAAYDHGGYKKAGEHRETKVIPREQKTDYTHHIDQSTEQAQIVKIGRYSTTDSSQDVTQPVTTEPTTGRRAKRPKSQRSSWLRNRHAQKEIKNARSTTTTTAAAPKSEEKSLPTYRRHKYKTTKAPTLDLKNMDESKISSTRKPITELDIKPTTYRPVPPKFLSTLKTNKKITAANLKKPTFKPPRISKEGYKFEDPFENFKDFSQVKMVTHPSTSQTKTRTLPDFSAPYILPLLPYRINEVLPSPYRVKEVLPAPYRVNEVLPVPYRPSEINTNYVENRQVNKIPQTVMYIKPSNHPEFKYEYYTKLKNFPYEMVDTKKSRNEKKKTQKRIRINFPYKIVDVSEVHRKPTKSSHQLKQKKTYQSIFGQPDTSPWIPLTSREVYDIHGYDTKRVSSDHRVKEEHVKGKKLAPIRVYDTPKVVATSYTVHHVYKSDKNNPTNTPDSSNKLKSFGSTPVAESTVSRVTVNPSNYILEDTKANYDILAAHSSDIRDSFSHDRTSSPSNSTSQVANVSNSAENVTPRDLESLEEDKDIETLSSNRYSVFHRMNATTPLESTTASLNEMNDEFNRLFLNEQDKFLFRHPHLSRETSRFIKPRTEDPIKNTTTKRDIVFTNLNNGSITHLTKVSKRNDNYAKPLLVYPQDYTSSAKYVERLTLAHFSIPENVAYSPLPLNYQQRIASLTNHLRNDTRRIKRQTDETEEHEPPPPPPPLQQEQEQENEADNVESENENEELVTVSISGTTTEIPVDVKKYPFYKTLPSSGLSKYSVLRYVSNPENIPAKRGGKMSFYESRKEVECEEPQPPDNIVPERGEGDWAYNPKPQLPRVQLGDKISCLKVKFFGSDPLDNPFFKEEIVGFPEVLKKPNHRPQHIENVESGEDYEVVPKKLLKSKKNKNKRRPRNVWNTESFTKSPVRLWIESLAKPQTEFQKLFKRSARENLNDDNNATKKRAQKVIFVGGFINRGHQDDRPKKSERTITTESSADNEINKVETYPDTSYLEETKRFNDEFSFTPKPLFDDPEEKDSEHSNPIISKKFPNTVYLPAASRIVTSKAKNHYVDASSSLRNLQNSSQTTEPVTDPPTNQPRYMLQYKEPTWRRKKPEPQKMTPQIDSLLYVIHPDGEGRWMRLLKVEEIAQHDSIGSSNNDLSSLIPPTSYPSSTYWHNDEVEDQKIPCQYTTTTESEAKKSIPLDYDVYHISGLMKQVAPLKASEVEINNLQTTDAEEIEHENDESNSYYDLHDIHTSSTQFPEPHERLYYYVLDDENDQEEE